MKKSFFLACISILVPALALAQASPQPADRAAPSSPAAPSATPDASGKIAPGVVIPAELSKAVDARKVKAGDKVEAKTAVDLLSNGKIVIPRNAKIIGHITDAKPRTKQSPDSMVAISFDKISTKDGRELPVQATVQAIGRPLQASSLPGYEPMGDSPPTGAHSTLPEPGNMGGPSGGNMGGPSGGSMGGSGGSMGGPPGGATNAPQRPTYPSGAPEPSYDASARGASVSPLGPTSQGVVGIKGLSLSSSPQASVVSSNTENVHLDSGTQLILRTE
jgi:hypothetical protein